MIKYNMYLYALYVLLLTEHFLQYFLSQIYNIGIILLKLQNKKVNLKEV